MSKITSDKFKELHIEEAAKAVETEIENAIWSGAIFGINIKGKLIDFAKAILEGADVN